MKTTHNGFTLEDSAVPIHYLDIDTNVMSWIWAMCNAVNRKKSQMICPENVKCYDAPLSKFFAVGLYE